jgi:Tat protein secretion system quality control protein TatD with DNase activity
MGFLKDSASGKEPDPENDPAEQEKKYEKMYMKIGRDFLHKEDFTRLMNEFVEQLIQALPTLAVVKEMGLDFESDTSAMTRAKEYKLLLDSDNDASKTYKDLIDLSEE